MLLEVNKMGPSDATLAPFRTVSPRTSVNKPSRLLILLVLSRRGLLLRRVLETQEVRREVTVEGTPETATTEQAGTQKVS